MSAPISANPYGSPEAFCTLPEHVATQKRCTWDKLDAAECYFKNHPGSVGHPVPTILQAGPARKGFSFVFLPGFGDDHSIPDENRKMPDLSGVEVEFSDCKHVWSNRGIYHRRKPHVCNPIQCNIELTIRALGEHL